MCKKTFRKPLVLFFIGICLGLLPAACQSKVSPTQDNEMAGMVVVPETPVPSGNEVQSTPEKTSMPTQPPAMTATAIPQTPQPTPIETPVPTVTVTRSPFGGWLVFSSRRQDTNGDGMIDVSDGVHLYSLNLLTQELAQLTSGNHRDLYPAWSPDRSQIAFVSNRDGSYELYMMNADGSEVKRLTNTLEEETKPRWSPDGTQIVYVQVKNVEAGLQEKRIHLISVMGDDVQQLTNGPKDDDPDWSLDGRYLVFTRVEEFRRANGSVYNGDVVYLMDMQTEQTFSLTASAVESGRSGFDAPRWLPRDGHFLSMTQVPGDVASVDVKVFELVWEDGQPALYRVFHIADVDQHTWGPNGEWLIGIVFNSSIPGTSPPDDPFYDYDFILLPVDFSTQRRALSADPAAKSSYGYSLYDGELITDNAFYDDYPDWAP